VRNYLVTLSSIQPSDPPQVLDHYLFLDPLLGINFVYPNSANGGFFVGTSYTGALTADSENIYPWGYPIQTAVTNIEIGPLKGPYTLTFSPTGLDTSKAAILKIIYNFGDGTNTTVNRSIVPKFRMGDTLSAGDPNAISVSHEYYPQSIDSTTVYNPIITVINGNMVENVFNITLSTVPASIYDFNSTHLISNTQQSRLSETQNVFEVEQPNYLTVARVLSTTDAKYTTPPFFSPETLAGYEDNLILWLDALDALTLSRDRYENVLIWYDKSSYQNNFFSDIPNIPGVGGVVGTSPQFQYQTQSTSLRKSVLFEQGKYLYALSDSLRGINSFDAVVENNGYTVFAVMRLNSVEGTLFSYDLNMNEELNPVTGDQGDGVNYVPNFNISFNQPNALTVEQGDTSYYFKTSATDDSGGIYQPTTISNISQNLTAYSLFSVTVSGTLNAQAYITADTLIARRRNQSYQYNLSSFLSGGFNSSTVLYPPTGQYIEPGTYDKKLVYALLGRSNAYIDSYLTDTEISEIIIYNKPLDPVSIANVQNYLVNKWNLTLRTD
jgi:hypothetical protein